MNTLSIGQAKSHIQKSNEECVSGDYGLMSIDGGS